VSVNVSQQKLTFSTTFVRWTRTVAAADNQDNNADYNSSSDANRYTNYDC